MTAGGERCSSKCGFEGYSYAWCYTGSSWGYCTPESFLEFLEKLHQPGNPVGLQQATTSTLYPFVLETTSETPVLTSTTRRDIRTLQLESFADRAPSLPPATDHWGCGHVCQDGSYSTASLPIQKKKASACFWCSPCQEFHSPQSCHCDISLCLWYKSFQEKSSQDVFAFQDLDEEVCYSLLCWEETPVWSDHAIFCEDFS